MNKIIYLFAIIFPLLMGSCSFDEFTEPAKVENEISVIEAVSLPFDFEGTDSRTVINMGNTGIDLPVWAEGDTIGIYPSAGGDQLSFPITDGIGTNTCVFSGGGWALRHLLQPKHTNIQHTHPSIEVIINLKTIRLFLSVCLDKNRKGTTIPIIWAHSISK